MKLLCLICFLALLITFNACTEVETASEILQKTICAIDTIETIYYKQDMTRSNPSKLDDTISRYREMYFKRLVSDSIVGVQGHWYMYTNDKINNSYEDIYDGKKLIRKNNRDSIARVYDLVEYPQFKEQNFWSHNTPYGMQFEFRFVLANAESYSIERINDTIAEGKNCYQIAITLENKTSMPGFATQLEENKGIISSNLYLIDKLTFYPIVMLGESYSIENPEQKIFIFQKYFDIEFNLVIDDNQFNTSFESTTGFEIQEMKPQ